MSRYIRVHVGDHSDIIRVRPGETLADAIDRGVVTIIDTIGVQHAVDVRSETVSEHEVARVMGVDE